MAVQNLDAVLGSNDGFRYQGATTGVWEDLFKGGVKRILAPVTGGATRQEEMRPIANPTALALENLLRLEGAGQGRRAWRENEKVRIFTRYAALSPAQLTRERALLALVPHARRLGVDGPPRPFADGELAANAPELMEALDGLVDAATSLLARGDGAGASARADFDAAVEVLRASRYDIAGGSRLLRALGPFLRSTRLPKEPRARLEELSIEVQRELVAQALAAGLRDRSAVARAAAFRAHLDLFGGVFVIEGLRALSGPVIDQRGLEGRFTRFSVPPVPVSFDEVFLEVCGDLARNGLPAPALEESVEGIKTRGAILWVLTVFASQTLAVSDRARFAAMDALETVSGGELSTLREEEWTMWFVETADELEEAMRAMEELEQSGRS